MEEKEKEEPFPCGPLAPVGGVALVIGTGRGEAQLRRPLVPPQQALPHGACFSAPPTR